MMAGITETIGKLLSKADSTESRDESHALFAKAQQLASKHSIDLTMARASHASKSQDLLEDRSLTIGAARSTGLKQRVSLFSIVARANDVRLAIRTDSTVVYPVGFASDLDMAERIYRSLVAQMERFGDGWVRSRRWEGDDYGWEGKPVTARVARRLFYEGFIQEIHARLAEARNQAEADAERTYADATRGSGKELSSLALALRDKTEQVDEFRDQYYKRANVRGRWRGSKADSFGGRRSVAAGERAGSRASMSGSAELDG
ncbi:MAG: DUF2786 domain-containing protein [Propionibacterium sp.]|nr:DUF2786 domain-containing protein [Propionibacterium sp.]